MEHPTDEDASMALQSRRLALGTIDDAPFSGSHLRYVSHSVKLSFWSNIQGDHDNRIRIVRQFRRTITYCSSFTGAYGLFAVSFGNIIFGFVYYSSSGELPDSVDTAIKLATLIGVIIGQVAFGLLNDVLGRRKVLPNEEESTKR